MEASGAVEGQQDTGAEQAQGTEEQENGQSPDLQPIFERLEQMGQDFNSELDRRFAAFEQPLEQPEPQGPDELQQVLESDDPDPQQARQVLDRMVEQKANEMLSPIAQEIAELRAERAGERLMEKYPEFRDTAKAEAAVQGAFDLAMQMTRGNEELSEWLAQQPQLIETAYLAEKARERAADEQSGDSEGEVELESAGAARPGQADPDDQLSQAIMNAGGERNPLFHG